MTQSSPFFNLLDDRAASRVEDALLAAQKRAPSPSGSPSKGDHSTLTGLRCAPRAATSLALLGFDVNLCGHGLAVMTRGYLYVGDGVWTWLWPTCAPVVGAGDVALAMVRVARNIAACEEQRVARVTLGELLAPSVEPSPVKAGASIESMIFRVLADSANPTFVQEDLDFLGLDVLLSADGDLVAYGCLMVHDDERDGWTIPSQGLSRDRPVAGWLGVKFRDAQAVEPSPVKHAPVADVRAAFLEELGCSNVDHTQIAELGKGVSE